MAKDFEQLLTEGLQIGYAGKTKRQTVEVDGIILKQSTLNVSEGNYLDQWSNARNGGGRELAISENTGLIRTYVGGVLPEEQLTALGTSEEEVIKFLINTVGELGGQTRLHNNCSPEPKGKFRYEYLVTGKDEEFQITTAQENIFFDERKVFTHWFTIGPVTF